MKTSRDLHRLPGVARSALSALIAFLILAIVGSTLPASAAGSRTVDGGVTNAAPGVGPLVAEPLEGSGKNIVPVSHFPIGGETTDLQLAGNYAYIANSFGLFIINISDPAHPRLAGIWGCKDGWGDIDISVDGNLVMMVNAHGGSHCDLVTDNTGVVLIDASDKRHPTLLSTIENGPDAVVGQDYTHTATLDGDRLFLNPQVFAGYPRAKFHVPVYDISDPSKPKLKSYIDFPGPAVAHDSYVDHRPDGKTLFYSASLHTTDVFDITHLGTPVRMQTTLSPEITISHQAEPNWNRKLILIDDETLIGAGPANPCGRAGGSGAAAVDVGSLHIYDAAPDGTFANQGLVERGSYNAPPHVAPDTCTGHVFWQAPDENRLTQAWYSEGARVIDFSDPENVKELGSFVAKPSTMYWSAKPHCGYIFASDMERGLDILRYTGEHGKRWPATAGPADVQRAQQQDTPLPRGAGRCHLRERP